MTKTRSQMALTMVIAVAIALVAQIVGSSGASAAVPRPVIRDALSQFDSKPEPKTARAKCPVGTRIIGGGARVNGGQHVVITRQQPVQGSPDTFVVSAVEDQVGTAQSWAVQATAICSTPLPGLEIVSATGPAGSFGFQGQGADCSPGKFALGVGGRINNGAGQVALSTQGVGPQRTGAGGFEDRDGFSGLWSVTAFAVCASLTFGDVQVVSVQTPSDTTARKIFNVDCPAGMNVTGGAAFTSGVVEVVNPTATRVQVIARAEGLVTPADQWSVTGYAFCAS
ncbi:MAG TPA: hypothetical protein VLL08_10860 [Kineosporiaceae bacterium]|nr:hypothetical protein [Kineosporiaceae bacterium]